MLLPGAYFILVLFGGLSYTKRAKAEARVL
jgi:hypothetical protein